MSAQVEACGIGCMRFLSTLSSWAGRRLNTLARRSTVATAQKGRVIAGPPGRTSQPENKYLAGTQKMDPRIAIQTDDFEKMKKNPPIAILVNVLLSPSSPICVVASREFAHTATKVPIKDPKIPNKAARGDPMNNARKISKLEAKFGEKYT